MTALYRRSHFNPAVISMVRTVHRSSPTLNLAGGAPFSIDDAAVSLLWVPHLSQALGKVRKLRIFISIPVRRASFLSSLLDFIGALFAPHAKTSPDANSPLENSSGAAQTKSCASPQIKVSAACT